MIWLNSGSRVDSLTVEGGNILDLEIQPGNVFSTPLEPNIDPAIVSYRRPVNHEGSSSPKHHPKEFIRSSALNESIQITLQDASRSSQLQAKPPLLLNTNAKDQFVPSLVYQDEVASATLTKPFNELSLNGIPENGKTEDKERESSYRDVSPEAEQTQPTKTTRKNVGRRGGKGLQKGRVASNKPDTVGHTLQQDTSISTKTKTHNGPKRSRGWRQTPLTEEASQSNQKTSRPTVDYSTRPDSLLANKKSRNHQLRVSEDQNDWATGEASDIQEMGDFDFEGNLSKFDKRRVFDKIRQEDTTADEERLVSFNRLPKRGGTASGKNLHHSENVLDSPMANGQWKFDESEKDDSEHRISSSRSSRKNPSHTSLRKPPSRKGSSMQPSDHHNAGHGLLSDSMLRTRYSSQDQTGSPKLAPNQSSLRYPNSHSRSRPCLRILPSSHICPCLTPLQMAELEQLAISELGLTDDIISENAARGIAETARRIAIYKGDESNTTLHSGSPLVAILAGNNKSGARAIAAGRHLRNHATRVIVCVLGLDHEEDLLDSVRRQLNTYRNSGGVVTNTNELSSSLEHLQTRAELFVDALFGMHISFDDLRSDDRATYFQLATWVNKNETNVLSVDVPSGLDASNGT